MSETHTEAPPSYPAVRRVRRAGQRDRRAVRRGRAGPAGVLGGAGRSGCPGRLRSPRCSTGRTRRSRSGSSAASSTSPTTASTATSRPATATGWRSTGRASRSATPATITYAELKDEVCKAANALTELGLRRRRPGRDLHADGARGDRRDAGLRAPRRACTRWCSPGSPRRRCEARIEDAEAKLVITTDGQYRRGKAVSLKEAVDEAVDGRRRQPVEHVLVVRRTGIDVAVDRGPRPVVARDGRRGVDRAHARGVRLPSIRCSCSTPRAPPASPRASCTPRAAT